MEAYRFSVNFLSRSLRAQKVSACELLWMSQSVRVACEIDVGSAEGVEI